MHSSRFRFSRSSIDDEFWSPKYKVWREVTIRDCFAKFEKDGRSDDEFDKIRDGAGGDHGGPPWYDGLIYEMIRGSRRLPGLKRDAELESPSGRLHRAIIGRGDQGSRRLPEHLDPVERADASLGLATAGTTSISTTCTTPDA